MNKNMFVTEFTQTRDELQSLISLLISQNKLDHKIGESWNVKDIIAHINWYNDQMIQLISNKTLEGSDYWNKSLDKRNNIIYKDFKHISEKVIIDKFEKLSIQLEQALKTLSEDDFHNSSNFKSMPSEWIPWEVFNSNLQGHYRDHIQKLKEVV